MFGVVGAAMASTFTYLISDVSAVRIFNMSITPIRPRLFAVQKQDILWALDQGRIMLVWSFDTLRRVVANICHVFSSFQESYHDLAGTMLSILSGLSAWYAVHVLQCVSGIDESKILVVRFQDGVAVRESGG